MIGTDGREIINNGRIAVPSVGSGGMGGQRSEHFGHCDAFTLVDVENGEISNVTVDPKHEHKKGVCLVHVNTLSALKVNALVVAEIGLRPFTGFVEAGINVYYENVNPEIGPVM